MPASYEVSTEEALLDAGSRFLGREKIFLTLASILAIFAVRTVTDAVCASRLFRLMCMYPVGTL